MSLNFPSSPALNSLYTLGTRTWKFNGAGWEVVPVQGELGYTGSQGYTGSVGYTGSLGYTGSQGESSFTYGPTAPSTPAVGDRWFDSEEAAELVWTNDGDSSQWVEVVSSGFVGYTGSAAPLNIPSVNQTSTYVLSVGDVGKYINITTGGVTIPSGIFTSGDIISIYNNSSSNQTITSSGVTTYLVGTATTGNRTLAQRGLATILCVASNQFVISGGGLS